MACVCKEAEIDGWTLAAAGLDDLIDLGFTRLHAKTVLSVRNPSHVSISVDQRTVVTEAELAELERFGSHRELLVEPSQEISGALSNLSICVGKHRQQVDGIFQREKVKLEQAQMEAHRKLSEDETQFKSGLSQQLSNMSSTLQTFEATVAKAQALCSTSICLAEPNNLKQRQTHLAAIVQECLKKPITNVLPSGNRSTDGGDLYSAQIHPKMHDSFD